MSKKPSRLANEIVEMADAQHRLGIMDSETHREITVKQLRRETLSTDESITGSISERSAKNARMS
jgi:putative transcriptional regulator